MSRTTTRVITLPRGRDDSLLAIPYGAEPGSTPAKQKEAEPGPRVSLSVSLSLPGPSLSLSSDHVRCRCRRRRRRWRRRRRLSSAAKEVLEAVMITITAESRAGLGCAGLS